MAGIHQLAEDGTQATQTTLAAVLAIANGSGLSNAFKDFGVNATVEVIAAPGANKRLRILGGHINPATAGTAILKSAATAKSGTENMAGAGVPVPVESFVCATNEALNLVAAGGGSGTIHVNHLTEDV